MNIKDAKVIIHKLIEDCGMTPMEALKELHEMRRAVAYDGADPEELLHDIGLEPDYIFALI